MSDGTLLVPNTKAPSCWTNPDGPPILGTDPVSGRGICQECMVENGTDPSSHTYEIWVRDVNNRAVGGIGPSVLTTTTGPVTDTSSHISFLVGTKWLNMWSALDHPGGSEHLVYLVWGQPIGSTDGELMQFPANPFTFDNGIFFNCDDVENDKYFPIRYIHCSFHCQ